MSPTNPEHCPETHHALSHHGSSEWSIVTGSSASPSTRHAAEELQSYLEKIGGAKLPIKDDTTAVCSCEIWVGPSTRWLADETLDFQNPGAEGILLLTGKHFLLIAGEGRRGTLYATYKFLETYLGCRWFTSEVRHIPTQECITIPPLNIRETPVFEYREPHCAEAQDPVWAVPNRHNGHFPDFAEHHGGGVKYVLPFVHTFNQLVPVEHYFDEHPEYFSEIDGVRIREETQLCLSHPDVLDLSLQRIKEWLQANPEASIVSVSQNDWGNPCQCPSCRSVDEEEGNFSGSLIRFVNRIAEAIEPIHPHVAIDTLAYQYTRKAPRHVHPRHNVIVRLCSIECCFSHPLENCREKMLLKNTTGAGATFVDDLKDWGRISQRLYIWDYVTNFANYVLPFPNLEVLAPNLRLFARHNVKGVFAQGANPPGGGGEFAELRAYLLAKLMWNPAEDEKAIMREFLIGVYGCGGEHLLGYIHALHDLTREKQLHASIYDRPDSDYLTPELLSLADECFDRAEQVAENQAILKRIRKARLPVRYAKLCALPMDTPDLEQQIDTFATDAAEFGITQLSEHIPMEKTLSYLRQGIHLTHFARYDNGWSPFDEHWPTSPA